jgi:translation elongation factor EF-1beta
MGEVAIRYRVMPESMDVNLNELKEVLEDELTKNTTNAKIQGKIISQIKGVQSIETIEMSLL